ncbi:(S)-ureidoglycine aminohydrolase [Desulfosediminicola flagellatus]|uniref:(S)-ureidoglycine aminohydrolase n=1 Tax=Desulfosediminicola flagellatus TaxID=2569541 RepID=UPI0010AC1580|nr:(S)-ureidoglycine aminohydrolase [Desulfosediminicola flagellatus]
MTYPQGLLTTRAVIRPGQYAVIPPEGRVKNVIPSIQDCEISILASPKLGASFVQYIGTAQPGGGTLEPFASEAGIECFLFVLDVDGSIDVSFNGENHTLAPGGFVYVSPDHDLSFTNTTKKPVRFLLYKQRYIPFSTQRPHNVVGNINDIEEQEYDDMANVFVRDLLPTDVSFDMNMHTLSFEPAGSHPFVETHVQEHGAYIYEGEGIYLLGDDWIPVQNEDFIFFGPYTPQAVYATGRGRLTYIYSKDCNRDIAL